MEIVVVEVVTHSFTANALDTLGRRYLVKGENGKPAEEPITLFRRVAHAIADQEKKYGATEVDVQELTDKFFNLMWSLDFMPNSPTLMNAGLGGVGEDGCLKAQGTLSACYVLNVDDHMPSICETITQQAMIEKYGGGVGFSLSHLRPKGAPIATTQGKSCGPIEVLRTFSQIGRMITQGGKRDGAHMAILEVYHPDIEEFIHCKNSEGLIHNFNISVGADSNFMTAVQHDKWIKLAWPLDRNSYDGPQEDDTTKDKDGNYTGPRYIRARELWNEIIQGAWLNGEPGCVWLDRMNQDNTTPEIGQIHATNPCGEQPLLPYESCNLGSINLSMFIKDGQFDIDRFRDTVSLCIRFLDNVVDANTHPTPETAHMNETTRKVGLGIMGFADALSIMDIPYDSLEALDLAEVIGFNLKNAADNASSELGREKGSFPAFDRSTLNITNGGDWEYMRNAWRLSIAPTGTISMISTCSSGIEPHFDLAYVKHNLSSNMADAELRYINRHLLERLGVTEDYIVDHLLEGHDIDSIMDATTKRVYPTSNDISYDYHVRMQAAFQKYVDSGISKTINLPNEATQHDVGMAYEQAWELGCKGITVYRESSRQKEVLTSLASFSNDSSASLDTWDVTSSSIPATRQGTTTTINTGHGKMHVVVNTFEGQPVEVFATVGKAGACEAATTEALGRLVSTALQYGVPLDAVVKQLSGITCCPLWDNGQKVNSLADAIGQVLKSVGGISVHSNGHGSVSALDSVIDIKINSGPRCPECGDALVKSEGCATCRSCGYSKCG